jgi:hypothetical protein
MLCQNHNQSFMHLQPLSDLRQNCKRRRSLPTLHIAQVLSRYRAQKVFLREPLGGVSVVLMASPGSFVASSAFEGAGIYFNA